jgi:cysteine desulfurase/selenocysteine lyase
MKINDTSALGDKFEQFREGFPATKGKNYLTICDKMILHDQVRAAVDQFLDHLAFASANRLEHEVKVEGARRKFAQLMHVSDDTIATMRNVSDGINAAAWALPLGKGDNVVLTIDAEHPNNIYPWLRQKKQGMF